MKMKKNVASYDRGLRLVVGLAILIWGYFSQSYWGFIGLVPLITGAISWCPAYTLFHFSTCPRKGVDSSESRLS